MKTEALYVENKQLTATENSFQRHSLNTKGIQSNCTAIYRECMTPSFNSRQTMPQTQTLPFYPRALYFEESPLAFKLQQQVEAIHSRFLSIHKILINHSQFESDLHEKKKGYKAMSIDWNALPRDFSNKVNIIADITTFVNRIEDEEEEQEQEQNQMKEALETKFQEYYLERHYGGLSCELGNLSIQQRLDCSSTFKEFQYEEGLILSKMENFQSLIPQSKITYPEQFCQTNNNQSVLCLQIPKIIEVQIPIICYKLQELVIQHQQEIDLFNNIDGIITKFSKPYEELYQNGQNSKWSTEEQRLLLVSPVTIPHTPVGSREGTSIVASTNLDWQMGTDIELAYSDFPEEDQDMYKLPLDSYAQIQSLISNSSRAKTDRSRPHTQRESPISNETIFITEKTGGTSIIQKYQENQKALIEENIELKQQIQGLRSQIRVNQKKHKQIENMNIKLANRLEQQIQQSQFYSTKLDELNAELLEEKVECLTHLNQSKQRKIQMLSNELTQKCYEICALSKHIKVLEMQMKNNDNVQQTKDQEIHLMAKILEEKEQELNELTNCQQNVIKMASQVEITLKEQIQILERQKYKLTETVSYYKQRMESEGISLQFEEATEIQGIIQQREHCFSLELKEVNAKYDEILATYQEELLELKNQLGNLQIQNDSKTKTIELHTSNESAKRQKTQQTYKQFESLITEYNQQLEQKDEQILTFKKKSTLESDSTTDESSSIQLILQRCHQTITVLERQLLVERENKTKLTGNLFELDRIVKKQIKEQKEKSSQDDEAKLIEELSEELEKKMKEVSALRLQIVAQTQQIIEISKQKGQSVVIELKNENTKLRRTNSKLKRYTISLEEQIRAVSGIDECESHKSQIDRLIQQRDYYLNLVTIYSCKLSAPPVIC